MNLDTPLSLLRDPNLPATGLLATAFNKYGVDCFDWEPEILRNEIDRDFSVTLTDLQSDKLQAAITILTTDHFESDWHTFNICVHLLNNEHASFDTLDPIDAEDIASVLREVEILRNNEDGIKFSDEINAYVGLVFSEYGCSKAPDIFPTAIMPKSNDGDMTEKNGALTELYQANKERIEAIIERLDQVYSL